jgi:hypothetical protein
MIAPGRLGARPFECEAMISPGDLASCAINSWQWHELLLAHGAWLSIGEEERKGVSLHRFEGLETFALRCA